MYVCVGSLWPLDGEGDDNDSTTYMDIFVIIKTIEMKQQQKLYLNIRTFMRKIEKKTHLNLAPKRNEKKEEKKTRRKHSSHHYSIGIHYKHLKFLCERLVDVDVFIIININVTCVE